MADWAGKTLGKVHIDDLVARGGMAEVYTGTHEFFGQVAVKVMRGLLDRDSDHLARFQREAEVVEELRHPNIVQMFDYAVVDETPCIIMEYIPGPSLAAYLKNLHDNKQRLPIGIVGHIVTSMASALDYAHSKGMVHRDIKPANVLLRSRSETVELDKSLPLDVEPVLTDFGLVRLLELDHAHDGWFRQRHAHLHEPRTGARRKSGQAHRYLFIRHHAVRDAGRCSSIPGRYNLRYVDETYQRASSPRPGHLKRPAGIAGSHPRKRSIVAV